MLRKERVHLTGVSNADSRLSETRRERKPLFEARYKIHELQLTQPAVSVKALSPRDSQSAYYKATQRPSLIHTQLSRPRTAALIGKRASIGGDTDPYVPLAIQKSKGRSRPEEQATLAVLSDKYHVTKDIEHRKASLETQLVPIVTNQTAEGHVNLKKIVELRRAVRRRYSSRSNFRKIFNAWDLNSQGIVGTSDIEQMLKQMGIEVNETEAKALITSITGSDNDTALKIDDFLAVVFDDNDKINVDIGALGQNKYKIALKYHDLQPEIKALALQRRTEQLQGTIKEYLQHKITDVSRLMTKADSSHSGSLNFSSFCDVLQKTELPSHMLVPSQLRILYAGGGGTDAGLNYKVFCDDIKNYIKPSEVTNSYDKKEVNPLVRKVGDHLALARSQTASEPRRSKLDGINVVDPRIQPSNKLEIIHKRAARSRNIMQDVFGSEEELVKALEALSSDGAISREQLFDFVSSHVRGFSKTEAESLLSSYIYNPQGVTDIRTVAKHVFSDELNAGYLLQCKTRPYPPVRPSTAPSVNEQDLTSVKRILQQIEGQLLDTGTASSFKLFKKFDVDQDGYISPEDFEKALSNLSIGANKREAQAVISVLDDTQKGYLTVTEFAERVQRNIMKANASRLKEREANHFVSIQPSTQFLERQLRATGKVAQFYSELHSSLLPPSVEDCYNRPKTSYQPKRGENIIQPLPNAPSFMPEQERLDRKSVNPINIDLEDRQRKQRCQTANAMRNRTATDAMLQRAEKVEDDTKTREERRVYTKALKKEEYENRCHMYYG